jgi:hypothetical protein
MLSELEPIRSHLQDQNFIPVTSGVGTAGTFTSVTETRIELEFHFECRFLGESSTTSNASDQEKR